jgi:hypothetical protein
MKQTATLIPTAGGYSNGVVMPTHNATAAGQYLTMVSDFCGADIPAFKLRPLKHSKYSPVIVLYRGTALAQFILQICVNYPPTSTKYCILLHCYYKLHARMDNSFFLKLTRNDWRIAHSR